MKPKLLPAPDEPTLLQEVRVQLLTTAPERRRLQSLLRKRHYLGGLKAVGQQVHYAVVDGRDRWLGGLIFSAAARHLKHRDQWIGWTRDQRERRLALVANNSRFVLAPETSVPNLASRVLRLALDRLPADWQDQYGHPVLVVETFVDPGRFQGTVYRANGWTELGQTEGWGRTRRDYYVAHDRPKRLFARALAPNARRTLQAEHLKPALAPVEKKVAPRCRPNCAEIKALTEHFKDLPDYRGRDGVYPTWSLVTLMLLAMLCEAPRGQKDLAKFARRLTQHQRRALGIRPDELGRFSSPSQSTFSRLLAHLDGRALNDALLRVQEQVRGRPPEEELIVLDGKQPRHGPGESILAAVTATSQFYLGSARVDTKTNEIPVARELFGELDLAGRRVALDALHTQTETARQLALDHGAHYLLTVKDNQPALHRNITHLIPAPPAGFSPAESHDDPGAQGRNQQRDPGEPHAGSPARQS